MSLSSKYDEINDFYVLLNAFIDTHEATTTETTNDTYKKIYNNEKVKDKKKRGHDYKQFEIIDNEDQKPKSTKKEETETKKTDEIQKPLWFKLNKNDFNSLIQDVYNNPNNDEFKTTVNKKAYDLKNGKKFLVKITTQRISEKGALKLYSDLIIPDITELEKSKSKGKDRRYNILSF